jgi:hypothetical protein
MLRQDADKTAGFGLYGFHGRPVGAGRRKRVPFEVEHGRHAAAQAGYIFDEPARLAIGIAAPVVKMVGPDGHARAPGGAPVSFEFGVEEVAALGGLEPCELDAGAFGASSLRPEIGRRLCRGQESSAGRAGRS